MYDAGTLNEVWPIARTLPAQAWQNLDPVAPAAGIKGTGGGR